MTTKTKTTETIEAAVAAKGFEQTVETLKDGMAKAAAGFEKTQAKVKEGMEKAMKTAEEMVSFGQGNAEAFVKAGQIWTTGVQDIQKQAAATAQASFAETVAAVKAFSAVKSFKDAFELQTSFTRTAIEKSMAQSGKLTEASIKLSEQALAPLTARWTLAVETFGKV